MVIPDRHSAACCVTEPSKVTGEAAPASGMDTISAGGTIACAMEMFEKGYLPEKEIGFKLNFGNGEALLQLLVMIGKKEGFGAVLSEGGYRLAVDAVESR